MVDAVLGSTNHLGLKKILLIHEIDIKENQMNWPKVNFCMSLPIQYSQAKGARWVARSESGPWQRG